MVASGGGVTLTGTPLETGRPPGSMTAVPPAKTAVRSVKPPLVTMPGEAAKLVAAAAERYGEAHSFYGRYCDEVHGRELSPVSPRERARDPNRIPVIASLLEKGIAAESAGLDLLSRAVNSLD